MNMSQNDTEKSAEKGATSTTGTHEFTVADVEKLAALSRLALTSDEKVSFAKEIGGILSYVGQIQEVSAGAIDSENHAPRTDKSHYPHRNIMREDVADKGTGSELIPDSSVLVESAPRHTEEYIQVKKILGGSQ